jgi:hypothetical protein
VRSFGAAHFNWGKLTVARYTSHALAWALAFGFSSAFATVSTVDRAPVIDQALQANEAHLRARRTAFPDFFAQSRTNRGRTNRGQSALFLKASKKSAL